jgi:hypothetical protein
MAVHPRTLPATASTSPSTLQYASSSSFYPLPLRYDSQSNIVKLIEPCAFPPQIGGKGHCTTAELTKARPIVNDMCNFFNATLYSSYDGCPQKLSESVTYDIIAKEGVMVFQ